MKFLIDGHRDRVSLRKEQWPDGVLGQLITPLTRYSLGHEYFAIDNGAFSRFDEKRFRGILAREWEARFSCLFVAVPDKVGDHQETLRMWAMYKHLVKGYPKAFVAQDGYAGMPLDADVLFIGGTDKFKDSHEVLDVVKDAKDNGKFVHVGRVNGPERYFRFAEVGADTCDGSGVSRYDHMILRIRDAQLGTAR